MSEKRPRMQKRKNNPLDRWGLDDAADLYGIDRWGGDIFTIGGNGNAAMCAGGTRIDLKALTDEIRMRGLELPVLIRFRDVLRHRFNVIHGAFRKAMEDHAYGGSFRPVYPIKVNQHRHVVEDVVAIGSEFHHGLEAGSKPELLIAIAHHRDPESIIVCNGFKDREYVDSALLAQKLGHKIFLVVEKLAELPLILDRARALKVEPLLGARMKLSSRGRGQWESSSGDKSKFGLQARDILEAIAILRRRRMLGRLQLLHMHVGSQITDIQRFKQAAREACCIFAEVRRLGAPINYIDVGGGMAVDYDGSRTNFPSSANYGPGEYAADIIDAVVNACKEASLTHPHIVIEAGRALVAHHSLLVVEAISSSEIENGLNPLPAPKKPDEVLARMDEIVEGITAKNFQEAYHDAKQARQDALTLFNHGHLSLEARAGVETGFRAACHKIVRHVRKLDYVPDDLAGLESILASTYFCNFSVFQSIPDHWAIRQLFPVMPLCRLDEKPSVNAVLADITCDSDGVIDQFVDLRDVRHTLPLHPIRRGEPYYIGIFLVGAYQEILGDLHNLFGDTTVVHVSSTDGGYVIDKTIGGDTVMEALAYVQFTRDGINSKLRDRVEEALRGGALTLDQSAELSRHFERMLDSDTYLSVD
ncbi:MAG: biosynthetic arginine decarboxylase [Planctomycetota bacterium]|jgi:arginine decarboxylase|nr:biosynthetic arginine decarboxylase [Planctomycetota bacterium]